MLDFFDSGWLDAAAFSFWAKETHMGRLFLCSCVFIAALAVRGIISLAGAFSIKIMRDREAPYEYEQCALGIIAPLKFIPLSAAAYACISILPIPLKIAPYTHALWRSILAFNTTWILYSLVRPAALSMRGRDDDGTHDVVITWFVRAVRFIVAVIGTSVILKYWGVEVSALITSLGIVGMAVALGAQDMFKNVIAGMSILVEKRFNVGDIVRIDSHPVPLEGIVENIGFRSTKIRKFDKTPMFVPNNTLADGAVINVSNRLYRRIEWSLRLELRTSVEQLKHIRNEIERYAAMSQNFVNPPEAMMQVRLDFFSDSAVQLLVYLFTSTNVWIDYLRIKEELLLRIKEIVEEAGAQFALPASSVYIEKEDKIARAPILPARLRAKAAAPETVLDDDSQPED